MKKLLIIIGALACIAIGYGLGNVHASSRAKDITVQAEASIKKGAKKVLKGTKETVKRISEELNSEE